MFIQPVKNPSLNQVVWGSIVLVIVLIVLGIILVPSEHRHRDESLQTMQTVAALRNAPPYSIVEYANDLAFYKENGFVRFGLVCGPGREPNTITIVDIGLSGSAVCGNAIQDSNINDLAKLVSRVISSTDPSYNMIAAMFLQKSVNRDLWLKQLQNH